MNTTSSSITPSASLLALSCSLGCLFSLPVQAAGQGVEAWRDFARRSMTPDYSWNQAPAARELAPSLRDSVLGARTHAARLAWTDGKSSVQRSLTLAFDQVQGAGIGAASTSFDVPDFEARFSPLRSRMFDATYEQDVGKHGRFGVSALVAQQQYATPGFGMVAGFRSFETFATRNVHGETADGRGARVDFRMPAGEHLMWRWSAQSRIEMNALESIHGIYAEQGDFDLPARLGTQVEWRSGDGLALVAGVERVYYGSITPFTSPALPPRLLSLMGDGSAPAFAWRDLTVYSAEGRVADRWHGEWSLRYTTRQQPSPTATLYRQALAPEYTNTNLALGYRHGLQQWGEVQLTASYAPSMAFLGPGPVFATRTYARGAIGEFEATWVMPF